MNVTNAMINAGADAMREGMSMLNSGRSYQTVCKKIFEAMLDAAPSQPAEPVAQEAKTPFQAWARQRGIDVEVTFTEPVAPSPQISDEASYLLCELVNALDNAFISSWQSTAAWSKQLEDAKAWLSRKEGK